MERGIEMSRRKPGHPPADDKERRKMEKKMRKNDTDRSIALAVLVANLFGVQLPLLLFYLVDAPDGVSACHLLEIEDETA